MEIQAELERIADGYLSSQNTKGLVIGVVCGGFEFCYCFGTTGKEGASLITGDTLFEIGSLTKVFTALLLADMAQAGEVNLQDPLGKHLPAGTVLPKRGEAITLQHLATHTSGLPRLPGNLMTARMDPQNPYAHYTTGDLYRGLATARLAAAPGTVYSYSNFGTGLLGHALALAAGKSYEQLVKERICNPLGMLDTSISLRGEQQARLAPGHARGQPTANWDMVDLTGAGGLRSSGFEMLRFLRAQLDPGPTSLPNTIRMAQQQQFGTGIWWNRLARAGSLVSIICLWHLLDRILMYSLPSLSMWSRVPLVAGGVLWAIWPLEMALLGRRQRMGLGWHIGHFGNKESLWHNGATGG
jgi:CubicO group peptidase (beta-lactamase class C family)